MCSLCRMNINVLNKAAQNNLLQMLVERAVDNMCYVGRFSLYLESCRGFSRHIVPGLLDNLSQIVLTPDYLCAYMNGCQASHSSFEPILAHDYIEEILKDKPDYLKNDDFIDNLYEKMRDDETKAKAKRALVNPLFNVEIAERKTISLIQFTDVHLDLEYKVGSNAICNNMLCCRNEDGFSNSDDPRQKAGPYGTLALCDVPPSVLYKMADKINELKPDTIIWGGDVTPHDLWN